MRSEAAPFCCVDALRSACVWRFLAQWRSTTANRHDMCVSPVCALGASVCHVNNVWHLYDTERVCGPGARRDETDTQAIQNILSSSFQNDILYMYSWYYMH